VSTPSEYLGWARTAKSKREREIFMQMAETWFAAALLAQEREGSGSMSFPDLATDDVMAALPSKWTK
jgi:hypothetical protein